MKRSDIDRLNEIKTEMKNLLGEAQEIIRGATFNDGSGHARTIWERAKAYWVGHMAMAIDDDHMYVGSNHSLQDTISELEEMLSEDEDEDEEEDEGEDA